MKAEREMILSLHKFVKESTDKFSTKVAKENSAIEVIEWQSCYLKQTPAFGSNCRVVWGFGGGSPFLRLVMSKVALRADAVLPAIFVTVYIKTLT